MLRETFRNAAYAVAPDVVVEKYIARKIINEAHSLGKIRESREKLLDSLLLSHLFKPLQKKSELVRFLDIVRARRPQTICEIGAAGCGTTFLLMEAAAEDAKMVTVDLNFTTAREVALASFALPTQTLSCLRGDSHDRATVDLVSENLSGRELELLYLDGDHSYAGVEKDFELYAPLVGPGGMIVFHDIVPDYKTKFGQVTSSNTGEVPRFWKEIERQYSNTEEIVEDYDQDGFGLGILHV